MHLQGSWAFRVFCCKFMVITFLKLIFLVLFWETMIVCFVGKLEKRHKINKSTTNQQPIKKSTNQLTIYQQNPQIGTVNRPTIPPAPARGGTSPTIGDQMESFSLETLLDRHLTFEQKKHDALVTQIHMAGGHGIAQVSVCGWCGWDSDLSQ